MEYGVRRYEAVERLRWFLFFMLCIACAYPVAGSYTIAPHWVNPIPSLTPAKCSSLSLWLGFSWLQVEPLGSLMLYLLWIAILFILLRWIILLVHVAGKYLVKIILDRNIKRRPGVAHFSMDQSPVNWNRLFPADLMLDEINRLPLQLVFHPFRRLRLMLNSPQGFPSVEELLEKERRASETDWEVISGSWGPLRWVLWTLPFLAFLQSGWLCYLQVKPAIAGQGDVQEVVIQALSSFLPIGQAITLVVGMSIAAGLVKRLESLYLSSVDSLLYDRLLSNLPFQSRDTMLLLESFQKNFTEIQSSIRRLERSITAVPTGGPHRENEP